MRVAMVPRADYRLMRVGQGVAPAMKAKRKTLQEEIGRSPKRAACMAAGESTKLGLPCSGPVPKTDEEVADG
ncbi:MAG TPA: hypothetical protein DCQ04_04365 [Actinobacteria bacterium]|nr:hypothetical protein [Actinomycetota bacterium]